MDLLDRILKLIHISRVKWRTSVIPATLESKAGGLQALQPPQFSKVLSNLDSVSKLKKGEVCAGDVAQW